MSIPVDRPSTLTPAQDAAADALLTAVHGAVGEDVTRMRAVLGTRTLVCTPEEEGTYGGSHWFTVSVDGAELGRLMHTRANPDCSESFGAIVGYYAREPIPTATGALAYIVETAAGTGTLSLG